MHDILGNLGMILSDFLNLLVDGNAFFICFCNKEKLSMGITTRGDFRIRPLGGLLISPDNINYNNKYYDRVTSAKLGHFLVNGMGN